MPDESHRLAGTGRRPAGPDNFTDAPTSGRGRRPAGPDEEAALRIYQRRMPHWRQADSVYHVVWRLHRSQRAMTGPERTAAVASLRHFDGVRYRLLMFVVMDDHVHVMVHAGSIPLERVVQGWKSFLSHHFVTAHGRTAPVWQKEYFDRLVRSEDELASTLAYVLYNPMERWPELRDYSWVAPVDEVRI